MRKPVLAILLYLFVNSAMAQTVTSPDADTKVTVNVEVASASLIVGEVEILTVAVLLSVMFIDAETLLIVTNELLAETSPAITVSVPSTIASANTGIVIVANVCPAGIVIVLVTIGV